MTATVHTFCRYCLASCGVQVTVEDNRVQKISADKQDPHSWHGSGALEAGATIVVVDPLRTESADKADVHLAVRPGQDRALLLAMVKVILDEGLEHRQDCTELATGVPELRDELVAQ